AIPLLAVQFPDFFSGHDSTKAFVLTLNDVIHTEVRKIYPDAVVPVFDFSTTDNGGLALDYRSPRTLGPLAAGSTGGAAARRTAAGRPRRAGRASPPARAGAHPSRAPHAARARRWRAQPAPSPRGRRSGATPPARPPRRGWA